MPFPPLALISTPSKPWLGRSSELWSVSITGSEVSTFSGISMRSSGAGTTADNPKDAGEHDRLRRGAASLEYDLEADPGRVADARRA